MHVAMRACLLLFLRREPQRSEEKVCLHEKPANDEGGFPPTRSKDNASNQKPPVLGYPFASAQTANYLGGGYA